MDAWIICAKLVQHFKDFRDDEIQQVKACQEVTNIVSKKDTLYQDLLREAGVVEAVLSAMATHATSLAVQMAGCEAVLNLAQGNEKTRIKLGASKACNVLVAALQRFSQESLQLSQYRGGPHRMEPSRLHYEELRHTALAALAYLTSQGENIEAAINGGVWRMVMTTMRTFSKDDESQGWGCRIISAITDRRPTGEIQDPAACQVVLSALTRALTKANSEFGGGHNADGGAAKGLWLACCAIASLTSHARENAQELSLLGACRQVERAMVLYNDPNVHEWGCRALAELASSVRSNQADIRTVGGCIAVVTALSKFPTHGRVQFAGCYAISCIAEGSVSNRVHFAEIGGIRGVIRAMEACSSDSHVQEWGCRALSELACDNPANQALIMEIGGVRIILSTIRNFLQNGRVQCSGFYALANLSATSVDVKRSLVDYMAHQQIERGMEACPMEPAVQEWGCRALAELAQVEKARGGVTGCTQVVSALSKFPNHARVQFSACYAIAQMALGCQDKKRCFGEAGATEKIVQAVLKFGSDQEVKTWAYKAMVSMVAREDVDPGLLKAASSLPDLLKLLRSSVYLGSMTRD